MIARLLAWWRRWHRRRAGERINDSIATDNERAGFAWPCFGGPLDGERFGGTPRSTGGGGVYEYCSQHQRFEWREVVKR